MARGLLGLGLWAVLFHLAAMGTGLASMPYHTAIGAWAVALGIGVPFLALMGVGRVPSRKIRERLVPFAAWQAILLGLTAWLGWSSAMNPWFHGLLGGLATGFGLVAMVVAWVSSVAGQRIVQGKRP